MSRTKNTIRNVTFSSLKFAVQLVLQFVLRAVIIYKLGAEYLGLNGLFTNVLGLLSIAELGIGGAITYSMYKPIAENDIEKVKALQNLYKKVYFVIALIVAVVGLSLTPALPYLIKDGASEININIYIVYILFLFNMVTSYFSAHKRSLLFAYQRNDVENKIKASTLCISAIIEISVILLFSNYYVYMGVLFIGTILDCVLVHVFANKLFPEINGKAVKDLSKNDKKAIIKNVSGVSLNQIGGQLISSTDNLILSSLFGLIVTGVYSNYALIVTTLISFNILLLQSVQGSAGNLVATTNKDVVYNNYQKVNFISAWFSGFCAICLITLFQPFMYIYQIMTHAESSLVMEFSIVVVVVVNFYINTMRRATNTFKNATGLMWYDGWKAIVECIINLSVSIWLAHVLGVIGIFLGTLISAVLVPLWYEPLILYKKYFQKSVWRYFGKFALYTVVTVGAGALTYWLCSLLPFAGIGWFVLKCGICLVVPNVIFLLCYFKTSEFKGVIGLAKQVLKRKPKQTTPVTTNITPSADSLTQEQGTMQTELDEQQNDSQISPKETTQIQVNNVARQTETTKKTKTHHT